MEVRKPRVFENKLLRRLFGPKRDEVTGEWRKLHNEELNDLFYLTNIMRVVKSRRIRRAVHRVLMGKPEEKRPLGEPDVDGMMILKWIFRKLEWFVGLERFCSG
jgi:hypothetical protein